MDRKLASIQRISKLIPHPNADRLDIAHVLGWQCVTAKDNGFKEGDLVVYFEIDSWIPHEIAPFLSKTKEPREYNGVKGEKLRTVRLRGEVSQGLILPFKSTLNAQFCSEIMDQNCVVVSFFDSLKDSETIQIGTDISERLGIQKWEAPIAANMAGVIKGSFPSWIPKTDEARLQGDPWFLEEIKKYKVVVTEKIDGSSMTCYLKDGEFGVCSRNLDLKEDENNAFWKKARELDIENKLKISPNNVAIQGELYGEGIQKNPLKLTGTHFAVYSVFNINESEYLPFHRAKMYCELIGLPFVPVYKEEIDLSDSNSSKITVAQMVDWYNGIKSNINPSCQAEGVVIRPFTEEIDLPRFGRLSFKVINNSYLLEDGDR